MRVPAIGLLQRIRPVAHSISLLSSHNLKRGPIRNGSTSFTEMTCREESLAIREPYTILQHWLLTAEQEAPECKPRVACVATVDVAGQPVTRLTNIEQINPSGIVFYTALGSRQSGEISTNPHVSLHFHWPPMERSVHISGFASPLSALHVRRQFCKYPHEMQLGMHGIHQSRLVLRVAKIFQFFGRLLGQKKEEEIPVPHHWGGFLLKPTLYEFYDSSRGASETHCMRFRRCLTIPRGMRNHTVNADCYDWVFDRCIDNDDPP